MPAGNTRLNQTGNGTTIVAPGLTAHVFSIGEATFQSSPVEDSDLGNATHQSFIPGDLIDPGMMDLEIGFTGAPPALNVPGTVTITFPKLDGTAGAGPILSGSGFFYKASTPQAQNGTLLKSKVGLRFDGKAAIPGWA